jgi:hypothetical protein
MRRRGPDYRASFVQQLPPLETGSASFEIRRYRIRLHGRFYLAAAADADRQLSEFVMPAVIPSNANRT